MEDPCEIEYRVANLKSPRPISVMQPVESHRGRGKSGKYNE